ncbi:MAG: hypothetical protein ACTHM7_21420 [Ginsengibacter sp.]
MHHEITTPSFIDYPPAFAARRPGKTRGAIGFSLIFCFFCIKAKERAKECIKTKERVKAPQASPQIRPPITGKATAGQTAGNTTRIKKRLPHILETASSILSF